jgi:hypothetical protein
MIVRRHLGSEQRDVLFAGRLADEARAQAIAGTLAHRRGALEVRKAEVGFSVTSVVSPEQRKQRGILRHRHLLAVAGRPSDRCERAAEHANFGNERRTHAYLPIMSRSA